MNQMRMTVTEARLARLLKRCKFDEAEKFAASFNLDAEEEVMETEPSMDEIALQGGP